MSVELYSTFPSPLYKVFKLEEHARDFMERGSLLMWSLSYFARIEDEERRDEDEGRGRVKIIGPRPVVVCNAESGEIQSVRSEIGDVYFSTGSIHPCYLYCFHGPQVDRDYLARGRYGRYVLRINDPDALVCEIRGYLERCSPNTMWLHCAPVRYDRDQLQEKLPDPASVERLLLSCCQKGEKDHVDCEYRLILRLPVPKSDSLPVAIRVELQRPLDCVDIVHWPSEEQTFRY